MFNQLSLFIMLIAPVVAFMAGAVAFSFIECVRKATKQNKYNQPLTYKNGL